MVADFPAAESRDVMLRLLLPDGSPAPQGGFVVLDGSDERFPVGLEGSVYLRGVDERQPARSRICRQSETLPGHRLVSRGMYLQRVLSNSTPKPNRSENSFMRNKSNPAPPALKS